MHLQSAILVTQNVEQVTQFFYEPSSLAKWDRSVAEMIPTLSGQQSVGATFDTIAPSGMKMSYEVIEFDAGRNVKILLKDSKMFKEAIWHFQFDPAPQGTKITCHVYFSLRFKYWFLYPVLFFNKKALLRDLKFLQTALNENYEE